MTFEIDPISPVTKLKDHSFESRESYLEVYPFGIYFRQSCYISTALYKRYNIALEISKVGNPFATERKEETTSANDADCR